MPTPNRAGGPTIARDLARAGLLATHLVTAALALGTARAGAAAAASEDRACSPRVDQETVTARPTRLRGLVVQEGEAPNGESPIVTLEAWSATPEQRERAAEAPFFRDVPTWRMEEIARIEPDADGHFEFDLPGDVDAFRLDVAGRYLHSDRPVLVANDPWWWDEEIHLRAEVGACAELRYTSDEGDTDALEGRRVVYTRDGHDAREATIDGDGIARLSGLAPGTWHHAITEVANLGRDVRLECHHADALEPFAVDRFPLFVCDRGDDIAVEVPLERAARMKATLVDADGAAIADAWFEATGRRRTAIGSELTSVTGRSGAEGQVRVPIPRSGIEAWEFGTFSTDEPVVVRLGARATEALIDPSSPVEVAYPGPPAFETTLFVEVLMPSGEPAAAVELDATIPEEANPDGRSGLGATATTGADGRAALRFRAAGTATVQGVLFEVLGADGRPELVGELPRDFDGEILARWSLTEEVTADRFGAEAPITLPLRACPTVRGTVAPARHPGGHAVHVESFEPRRRPASPWVHVATADPETGAFDAPLEPGIGLLRVRTEGGSFRPMPVDASAADTVALRWTPRAVADLLLVDGEDRIFRGGVRAIGPEGAPAAIERLKSGAFLIESHRPGPHRILASGAHDALDRTIDIPPLGDAPPEEGIVAMTPGARVVVTAPDVATLDALEFSATELASGVRWGESRLAEAGAPPADLLGALPPGRYAITARQGEARVHRTDVVLEAGEELTLDARDMTDTPGEYAGSLAAGSTGLGGLRLVLVDEAGFAGRARVTPTGAFTLRTAATGPSTLEIHARGAARPDEPFTGGVAIRPEPRPSLLATLPVTLHAGRADLGRIELGSGSIRADLRPRLLWPHLEGATLVARRVGGGSPLERVAPPRTARSLVPLVPEGTYEVFLRDIRGEEIDAIEAVEVTVRENEHVDSVLRWRTPR